MTDPKKPSRAFIDPFDLDNNYDAFRLLDLINAEFQSDPQSVQCFDPPDCRARAGLRGPTKEGRAQGDRAATVDWRLVMSLPETPTPVLFAEDRQR